LPGDPKEEENIVYNLEKKNEILKIIDPLLEIKSEQKGSDEQHAKEIDELNKTNKKQNYLVYPIKILITAIFIVSFGMVTNSIPTTNDIAHIIDDNIHHHYLKYGEAYGNKGDHYPWSIHDKVGDSSFVGEYNENKALAGLLHHSACYRT
jgi:predicted RND superfamily exporter protein